MMGQSFLDHMFAQRQISFKMRDDWLYDANIYIDLAIKPCKIAVMKHITAPDLSKRASMQDCAGNGATLNLAARKLNTAGYAQRNCGLVNTKDKVRKLKHALQLSQSMAMVSNQQTSKTVQKKIDTQMTYRSLTPYSLSKLEYHKERNSFHPILCLPNLGGRHTEEGLLGRSHHATH
jgi:hypothetical protein